MECSWYLPVELRQWWSNNSACADMDKKQIKRIEKMEANLDEARLAVDKLAEALSGYEEIQDKYYELANYYGSVQWMDDYESDEEGELPADLKRGVL